MEISSNKSVPNSCEELYDNSRTYGRLCAVWFHGLMPSWFDVGNIARFGRNLSTSGQRCRGGVEAILACTEPFALMTGISTAAPTGGLSMIPYLGIKAMGLVLEAGDERNALENLVQAESFEP